MLGVAQALSAQDNLAALKNVQMPLVATALFALFVLILSDMLIVRRSADWGS